MAELSPELQKVFDELRREVIESRNMTIKTDNALKSLHAELKNVSSHQEAFQRRTWFSNGAAYMLFVGLAVAGAVLVSGARAAAANAERERLEKQVLELNTTIEKLRADASATLAADQSALQVYKQMTTLPGDERLKGVDALARVDQARLSPFARLALQERSVLLRKEIGGAVLEKGRTAFRRSDWAEAITQLSRYLSMDPPEEDAVDASFYLGNAYFQSRKYAEAVEPLSRFIDGDKKARLRDFAMLMLMQSHDMTGNKDKAVALAREAQSLYPGSEFRGQFNARLSRSNTSQSAPAAQ